MDMIKWLGKQRDSLQRASDECKTFIGNMMNIDSYYMITEQGKIIHRINSEINQVLANLDSEIRHLSGPRIFVKTETNSDDTNRKRKHDKGSGRKKTDSA